MNVPAVAAVGDRVRVLVGTRWFPGTVVTVGRWSHPNGNTYPSYCVRLADGIAITCGNNSLRPARVRAVKE